MAVLRDVRETVLDGQLGFVEVRVFAHGLLDAGAGSTHQHEVLDMSRDLRASGS